jgi:hypothetical protein
VEAFLTAWGALPVGHFNAVYKGRRYGVTRTARADGRQGWLWAEELGGADRISGNLYRLKSGARLKPCEMSADKVTAFVIGLEPIDTGRRI